MAAGEASGDICSLLGLELICVVPAGFPAGKPWSWLEGWMEWMVLITSGKPAGVALALLSLALAEGGLAHTSIRLRGQQRRLTFMIYDLPPWRGEGEGEVKHGQAWSTLVSGPGWSRLARCSTVHSAM